MRNFSGWKHAAAALGLSLLTFSPAMAQNAAGEAAQAPDREARQNNPTESNPSNTNRSGTRTGAAGQTGQSGAATRQGTAGRAAGQAAQPRTANRPVDASGEQSADHQIAALLAICNQEEVALGKLAAEHVQNEDVKQFAQMLIEDHTKVLQQLRKVAPQAVEQASLGDGGENLAKSAETPRTERTASRTAGFDPVQVHKQIAQRCIESARKELGEKQGAEADMCFIGQQLVLHQQMIDKQHVFAQYASPELKQVIEESTQGAEHHLQQAKQLVKQLSPQAAKEVGENRTGTPDSDSPRAKNRTNADSQPDRPTGSRPAAKAGNR